MKKHALLIGVNAYPRLGDLRYAAQDAEAVSDVLTSRYGFASRDVTLMTCKTQGIWLATQNNIEEQLARLREIDDLELLVVGFWGHGISVPGGADCRRYLCAVDTSDQRLEKTGISLLALCEYVEQAGAKNTCLILGCCQNHAVGRGITQLSKEDRDVLAAILPKEKPVFRKAAVLNSCSFGERAYEWKEREHGIFTAHLLDAMRQSSRITDWIEYIQPRVYETARNMGQSQNPFASFDGGDIRFPMIVPAKPDAERLLVDAQTELDELIRIRSEMEAERTKLAQIRAETEAIVKEPPPKPEPVKTQSGKSAGERTVLTVKGVEYVFRWCPPGRFMMGSSASEEERRDNEAQHEVTLTRGFWLLETPVTQAMYKSMTGENPSYFTDSQRLPVEKVSWEDCQVYIEKLNALNIAPTGYRWVRPHNTVATFMRYS